MINWLPKKKYVDIEYEDGFRNEGFNEALSICEKAIEENMPKETEIIQLMCQKIDGLDHLSSAEIKAYAKAIHQRIMDGNKRT